ncbi:TonB-dependent receptor [Pedobacter caeni]|uniref:TonB-linked outer membrane protein, SusC/RagA family n=1 Tax=Pedobacter caeni TaxID=288992 RepID=A0A1M5IRI3_9SPHI|nr:TonB-dependent receptor [Pedobacter caeni]SHG30934.1 TonB-linked outer membrane protein, SusC/RagA family [Pedobacter caeni]
MKFSNLLGWPIGWPVSYVLQTDSGGLSISSELIKRIIMRTKITFVLLITLFLQVGQAAHAQRITLNSRNADLKTILKQIGKQSGYQFLYGDDVLSKTKPVDINVSNVLLEEVLKQCFSGQGIVYHIIDKTIVIKTAPVPLKTSFFVVSGLLKGKVSDAKGPMAGVTIKLEGPAGQLTKTTDENGNYIFANLQPGVYQLSFYYIGYTSVSKNLTVTEGQNPDLNILMTEATAQLGELVVVGYGTQKKGDLTGAIGVVNVEKQLKGRSVTNVQELLAGAIPGLNVTKNSGAVGSAANINIRGTQTMGNSSGVLVIIDGNVGNINTLNPNDIESISVLKDAASASIYGARAANGVMLVTTKQGKGGDGKPVVEFNESVGIQKPQFQLKFVGASDFMRLKDQALLNDGAGTNALYGEKGQQDLANGLLPDNEWYKAIYKNNALISNNNAAVSGNTEYVTYRLSASYDYQNGTLPNNNYNRYVIKPNLTVRLSDKISVAANLQYTNTYLNEPNGGTEGFQSQAIRNSPIVPIRNAMGQYFNTRSIGGNPIASINEGGYTRNEYKELLGNLDLNYSPVKDLNFQGRFARSSTDQYTKNRVLSYPLFNADGTMGLLANNVTSQRETESLNYRNTLQVTGDYSYNIGKHGFKLLAGYSKEYYYQNSFSAFRDKLPFNNIDVINSGASTNMQSTGTARDYAFQSGFGRLNYNYDERYLLQASIRADGSSYFGPGNKWGYYPTVSAGWNIHRESFFKSEWISQLKLRASYGEAGDAQKQIDNNNPNFYPYATILDYNPAIYGFNGVAVPGALQSLAVDPNIVWEVSKQKNIGVDLGLFKQRVNLSVDYFDNTRDRILFRSTAPAEFGLAGPLTNGAVLKNKGWEFGGNYADQKGDFSWGVGFNLSWSKTKVVNNGTNPPVNGNNISEIGQQFNLLYGLQAIGLFQSAAEIAGSPSQGLNIFPGNIKYKDVSGPNGQPDGLINGLDRVVLNTKVPMIFGLNLNFGWKEFDFSANLNGRFNNYLYLSGYSVWPFFLTDNVPIGGLDHWTPDNPNATNPRLSVLNTSNDTQFSSYWLRKANYLKIQNVQVGYTLPDKLLKKAKIKGLRLFLSGQNMATFSGINFDPEANLGYYPLSRTYSFGINAKL